MAPHTTKLVEFINRKMRNKKFRTYIALFSIVQGIFRFDDPLNYISIIYYATMILGISLLITTYGRLYLKWIDRVVVAILAALYAALFAIAFQFSPVSAIGALLITILLLAEASVINEC